MSGQRLLVYVKQPKNIYIKNPVNGNEEEDDMLLLSSSEKAELEKAEKAEESNKTEIEKKAEIQETAKYFYHTVVPGDTLFNIAHRYGGMTVDELKSLNNIHDGRSLKPGTKLKVKVKT